CSAWTTSRIGPGRRGRSRRGSRAGSARSSSRRAGRPPPVTSGPTRPTGPSRPARAPIGRDAVCQRAVGGSAPEVLPLARQAVAVAVEVPPVARVALPERQGPGVARLAAVAEAHGLGGGRGLLRRRGGRRGGR